MGEDAAGRRLPREATRAVRRFRATRERTDALAAPLSDEDQALQSMPDASPIKWHLAHTTWFFEVFVLQEFDPNYRLFDDTFPYLFNSYYEGMGPRHPRPQRGMLSRPAAAAVRAYRAHVDAAMERLLATREDRALSDVLDLGFAHEEQHQELMLTDVKHLFSLHPNAPSAYPSRPRPAAPSEQPLIWRRFEPGLAWFGADADGFAYDNERPRHQAWVPPFELAGRPVTNGEYADFIADGGYENPAMWLFDGWATVRERGWSAPAYWRREDDAWFEFTLGGLEPLNLCAPVCHISYYEANAYATWAGARLPDEREWEAAAAAFDPRDGRFLEAGRAMHPRGAAPTGDLAKMFGDVWEWTRSAYEPYPGFIPLAGAAGEYNGKFMCGQQVLRGGSCATPEGHVRATYRNFFAPDARWQFSGLRLARDV